MILLTTKHIDPRSMPEVKFMREGGEVPAAEMVGKTIKIVLEVIGLPGNYMVEVVETASTRP
jgi:hypothetical protein